MDSREPPQHSPPQFSSAPPNIMRPPGSFSSAMPNPVPPSLINANSSSMMMAPSTVRLPFPSFVSQSRSPPPPSRPSERFGINSYEGPSSALRPCGLSIGSPKRKRGRPRKYSPDGGISLGLAPTPLSSSGPADLNGMSGETPAKRSRGRPPGSGRKQLDSLGVGGTCFTPHVILVKTGEDIAAKLMAFCEEGPRTVCVLSANGAVCNASLGQSGTSGGTVYYEGRYQIVTLSGSFNPSEDGSFRSGGISVALAATDGKVVGGPLSGMLVAASPVQVIVGSFLVDRKKNSSSKKDKAGPSSSAATPPATQALNFGALPLTPTYATSQGGSSSSSDDDDGDGGDSPMQSQRGSGSGTGTGTGTGSGSATGPTTGPAVQSTVTQPVMDPMHWSHQVWPPQR